MDPAAVEARRLHILRKLLLRKEAKRAASLLTFGRVLLEGGQAVKSIPYFEEAARLAPSLAEPHFRLSLALRSAASSGGAGGELDASIARQVACLSRAVVIDPCFSPAWCNLSALEMRRGQHASALACAQRAVALSPELSDAHYNVGSTLRRLGRQDEAIELAWRTIDGIRRRSGALGGESAVLRRAPLDASRRAGAPAAAAPAPAPALVFVCVKWGTKYGAEYVNKLRHGVRRHCDAPHAFVCFTDDAAGLDIASGIIARPLPTGCWHTWWLKATLFGGDAEHAIRAAAAALRSTGGEGGGAARGDNGEVRALYVDLDSIIVGSLDALTRYSGDFATLGTEGFVNEGREGGFNSSVMLWSLPPRPSSLCGAAACEAAEASAAVAPHIYAPLARDFETITKVVHRFDHWLEMNIVNAALLQDFAPGVVVEFRAVCTETLPPEASLVTFPLQPKPHDFPAPWVAERWIMDSAAPADAPSSALPRALPAPTMPSISPMPPTTPIRRGPDFVIVGAMKGGTESIVAALRRHEEVWMPAGGVSGETHMFDRSVEKRSHLTVEAYCAYFAEERERANVRFVGEKSPVYMHLPRAMKRLARALPNAKIVVVLREPAARAWSHWNFWKRDITSFESIFNETLNDPVTGKAKRLSCQDVLRRGFYDNHLERIYELYPRERVHVAIAERVWKDPVGEYDRLFRFLGVAECAADNRIVGTAPRRENATENKAALAPKLRARLDAVYAPHIDRLRTILGERIPEWEGRPPSGPGAADESGAAGAVAASAEAP